MEAGGDLGASRGGALQRYPRCAVPSHARAGGGQQRSPLSWGTGSALRLQQIPDPDPAEATTRTALGGGGELELLGEPAAT